MQHNPGKIGRKTNARTKNSQNRYAHPAAMTPMP